MAWYVIRGTRLFESKRIVPLTVSEFIFHVQSVVIVVDAKLGIFALHLNNKEQWLFFHRRIIALHIHIS